MSRFPVGFDLLARAAPGIRLFLLSMPVLAPEFVHPPLGAIPMDTPGGAGGITARCPRFLFLSNS